MKKILQKITQSISFKKQNKNQKNNFGRTMMETLAVLLILGLLTVFAIIGLNVAMEKNMVNKILDDATEVYAREVISRRMSASWTVVLTKKKSKSHFEFSGAHFSALTQSPEPGEMEYVYRTYVLAKEIPFKICKRILNTHSDRFKVYSDKSNSAPSEEMTKCDTDKTKNNMVFLFSAANTCSEDSDCKKFGSGYSCLANVCLQRYNCASDEDCPTNYTCTSMGICQKIAKTNSSNVEGCTATADCPSGYSCKKGTCVPTTTTPTTTGTCTSNSDCASNKKCSFGTCVSVTCTNSSECGAGYECKNGTCQKSNTCSTTKPCAKGYYCSYGYCYFGCASDSDCPSGYKCKLTNISENTYTCVQDTKCSNDADCGGYGYRCLDGSCMLVPECKKNSDCTTLLGYGYICSSAKKCVKQECTASSDCGNSLYECVSVDGNRLCKKTKCNSNADCDDCQVCQVIDPYGKKGCVNPTPDAGYCCPSKQGYIFCSGAHCKGVEGDGELPDKISACTYFVGGDCEAIFGSNYHWIETNDSYGGTCIYCPSGQWNLSTGKCRCSSNYDCQEESLYPYCIDGYCQVKSCRAHVDCGNCGKCESGYCISYETWCPDGSDGECSCNPDRNGVYCPGGLADSDGMCRCNKSSDCEGIYEADYYDYDEGEGNVYCYQDVCRKKCYSSYDCNIYASGHGYCYKGPYNTDEYGYCMRADVCGQGESHIPNCTSYDDNCNCTGCGNNTSLVDNRCYSKCDDNLQCSSDYFCAFQNATTSSQGQGACVPFNAFGYQTTNVNGVTWRYTTKGTMTQYTASSWCYKNTALANLSQIGCTGVAIDNTCTSNVVNGLKTVLPWGRYWLRDAVNSSENYLLWHNGKINKNSKYSKTGNALCR